MSILAYLFLHHNNRLTLIYSPSLLKLQLPLVMPSGPVTLDSAASLGPNTELVTVAVMLMGCGAAAATTNTTASTTKQAVTLKLISGKKGVAGQLGSGNVSSCFGYVCLYICIFPYDYCHILEKFPSRFRCSSVTYLIVFFHVSCASVRLAWLVFVTYLPLGLPSHVLLTASKVNMERKSRSHHIYASSPPVFVIVTLPLRLKQKVKQIHQTSSSPR